MTYSSIKGFLCLACVCAVATIDVSGTRQNFPVALDIGTASAPSTTSVQHAAAQRRVSEYGSLPLSFEPIADTQHADPRSPNFLARGRGYAMELSGHQAALSLIGGDSNKTVTVGRAGSDTLTGSAATPTALQRFTLRFVGSRTNARGRGEERLPGKVHYLTGKDPSAWRTNIPTYAKVHYEEVYRGIDLVYYGTQGELEYDFVVAPGADPSVIALAFDGVDAVKVNEAGDLTMLTAAGELRQLKPFLYQEVDGERQAVKGRYVVDGAHVRVEVGAYDTSRTLVVDPVLVFAGGVGGAAAMGVAVDDAGNAYVAGYTHGPTGEGERGPHGLRDAFVKKIDAAGTVVLWTAFIGGSRDDWAYGIAIDATGSAYVTGSTRSDDFPTLNAFDFTYGGPAVTTSYGDAFVAKLTPDGSALLYSTYLGGPGDERGWGIAVRNGNAYVVGEAPAGFPTTPGAFQAVKPGTHQKGFVTQLDATGSVLVYSTYLGAPANGTPSSGGYPDAVQAIALDAAGNAYVTGVTQSNNFPTVNPAQMWSSPTTFATDGRNWAFVTKLNPLGSALVYSTYLGGGLGASGVNSGYNGTEGLGIAVNAGGEAFVTGITRDVNFPKTAGAFDQTCAVPPGTSIGCSEAFVTKLSASGGSFVYSSYLGGTNHGGSSEQGSGIAVDADGRAYVMGRTTALDFPLVDPFQATGGNKAFVSVVNPAGSALEYSTYLGGTDASDEGYGIALDANRNAYVVGIAISSDFPRVGGLPRAGGSPAHVDRASGFIAKFSAVGCAYGVAPTGNISAPGSGLTSTLNVTTMPGCNWAAWTSVPWLTVTPTSGTGSGAATYTVAPNSSTNPRTGTMTVAGTTVVVQQSGFDSGACSYTLTPATTITAPPTGTSGTITVTTTAGCTWATTSSVPWISISGSGPGSGVASYNVTPNLTSTSRTGSVVVAGQTVQVIQAGLDPGCTYTLTPATTTITPPAAGASGTITVTTTAGCDWTATSTVSWISINGSGPGSGVASYNVTPNLTTTSRTGSVVIAGHTVQVVQAGQPTTGPPGAPVNVRATVSGNTVNLTWGAPTSGGTPTGYSLVARQTAGGPVLATLQMGAGTSFSAAAPNGTFVLSVVAANASGSGPESTSVTVTVPLVGPAPGPPSNLTASVSGTTVSFAWSPPLSGGAVGNYVLVAGLTPAFSVPFATLQLGATPGTTVMSAPAGTYSVRVQAQNAGGTSTPSNEVTFTVAGLVPPGAPTLNVPTVNGSTVSLSWNPPTSGGTPTGYTLTASITPGSAPIATVPLNGTSASFSSVPSGAYYLRLTASNAAGTGPPSSQVALTVP